MSATNPQNFLLGMVVKAQTTPGQAETMPDFGDGTITEADGAVLGDPEGGTGESGISVQVTKNYTEKGVFPGSFTRSFANFVNRQVEGLSIQIPLKGNGGTLSGTPVFTEYEPAPGIKALFQAAGLVGQDVSGKYGFKPGVAQTATVALYYGGEGSANGTRIVFRDCQTEGMAFSFTPTQVASVNFPLTGTVDSHNVGTWDDPPFTFGTQASLSAPVVKDAGFTWETDTGFLPRTQGFTSLTIDFDNESENVQASNFVEGEITLQQGRTITISGTIDVDEADPDWEFTQLSETDIANASAMLFSIGTAATTGTEINAYQLLIPSPEVVDWSVGEPSGSKQTVAFSAIARATAANEEFNLIYQ